MSSPNASSNTDIRPFQVRFADEDLKELRRRIASARLPSRELVTDRSQGVQLETIEKLARYWTSDYDMRRCESGLNVSQFKTEIDGVDIHFIHVKSAHDNALPLIMTHGWPGSVVEAIHRAAAGEHVQRVLLRLAVLLSFETEPFGAATENIRHHPYLF